MNPLWTSIIYTTTKKAMKKCSHCGKVAAYPPKRPGQFYTCKKCGHKFKEKGK